MLEEICEQFGIRQEDITTTVVERSIHSIDISFGKLQDQDTARALASFDVEVVGDYGYLAANYLQFLKEISKFGEEISEEARALLVERLQEESGKLDSIHELYESLVIIPFTRHQQRMNDALEIGLRRVGEYQKLLKEVVEFIGDNESVEGKAGDIEKRIDATSQNDRLVIETITYEERTLIALSSIRELYLGESIEDKKLNLKTFNDTFGKAQLYDEFEEGQALRVKLSGQPKKAFIDIERPDLVLPVWYSKTLENPKADLEKRMSGCIIADRTTNIISIEIVSPPTLKYMDVNPDTKKGKVMCTHVNGVPYIMTAQADFGYGFSGRGATSALRRNVDQTLIEKFEEAGIINYIRGLKIPTIGELSPKPSRIIHPAFIQYLETTLHKKALNKKDVKLADVLRNADYKDIAPEDRVFVDKEGNTLEQPPALNFDKLREYGLTPFTGTIDELAEETWWEKNIKIVDEGSGDGVEGQDDKQILETITYEGRTLMSLSSYAKLYQEFSPSLEKARKSIHSRIDNMLKRGKFEEGSILNVRFEGSNQQFKFIDVKEPHLIFNKNVASQLGDLKKDLETRMSNCIINDKTSEATIVEVFQPPESVKIGISKDSGREIVLVVESQGNYYIPISKAGFGYGLSKDIVKEALRTMDLDLRNKLEDAKVLVYARNVGTKKRGGLDNAPSIAVHSAFIHYLLSWHYSRLVGRGEVVLTKVLREADYNLKEKRKFVTKSRKVLPQEPTPDINKLKTYGLTPFTGTIDELADGTWWEKNIGITPIIVADDKKPSQGAYVKLGKYGEGYLLIKRLNLEKGLTGRAIKDKYDRLDHETKERLYRAGIIQYIRSPKFNRQSRISTRPTTVVHKSFLGHISSPDNLARIGPALEGARLEEITQEFIRCDKQGERVNVDSVLDLEFIEEQGLFPTIGTIEDLEKIRKIKREGAPKQDKPTSKEIPLAILVQAEVYYSESFVCETYGLSKDASNKRNTYYFETVLGADYFIREERFIRETDVQQIFANERDYEKAVEKKGNLKEILETLKITPVTEHIISGTSFASNFEATIPYKTLLDGVEDNSLVEKVLTELEKDKIINPERRHGLKGPKHLPRGELLLVMDAILTAQMEKTGNKPDVISASGYNIEGLEGVYYTQSQLADAIGIKRKSLSVYFSGTPNEKIKQMLQSGLIVPAKVKRSDNKHHNLLLYDISSVLNILPQSRQTLDLIERIGRIEGVAEKTGIVVPIEKVKNGSRFSLKQDDKFDKNALVYILNPKGLDVEVENARGILYYIGLQIGEEKIMYLPTGTIETPFHNNTIKGARSITNKWKTVVAYVRQRLEKLQNGKLLVVRMLKPNKNRYMGKNLIRFDQAGVVLPNYISGNYETTQQAFEAVIKSYNLIAMPVDYIDTEQLHEQLVQYHLVPENAVMQVYDGPREAIQNIYVESGNEGIKGTADSAGSVYEPSSAPKKKRQRGVKKVQPTTGTIDGIVDEVTKPQTITSLSDLKNKWGYDMPVVSKAASELAKGGEITMQPLVPGAPMMGSGVSEQDAIVLKEYLIKTVGV